MTPPTHDEVIAWIDYELNWLGEGEIVVGRNFRASLLANRAVLERHKPLPLMGSSLLTHFHCADGCGAYCPTYLDIYNRIREVMG